MRKFVIPLLKLKLNMNCWNKCELEHEEQCYDIPHMDNCRIVKKEVTKYKDEEKCKTVTEKVCTTVTETECVYEHGQEKCWDEPREKCWDEPRQECHNIKVPYWDYEDKKECDTGLKPICRPVPVSKCKDVPKQDCKDVPREKCDHVPKEHCDRVQR